MATIPSPRTWVTGEVVTAAEMNTDIRDAVKFLLGGASTRKPSFRTHLSAVVSIANNTTATAIWNTADEDTDSGYSTGSGLYTVATAGLWVFNARSLWASNAAGTRILAMRVNSVSSSTQFVSAAVDGFGRSSTTLVARCAVSDIVDATVFQSSGGALNFGTGEAGFAGAWIAA